MVAIYKRLRKLFLLFLTQLAIPKHKGFDLVIKGMSGIHMVYDKGPVYRGMIRKRHYRGGIQFNTVANKSHLQALLCFTYRLVQDSQPFLCLTVLLTGVYQVAGLRSYGCGRSGEGGGGAEAGAEVPWPGEAPTPCAGSGAAD